MNPIVPIALRNEPVIPMDLADSLQSPKDRELAGHALPSVAFSVAIERGLVGFALPTQWQLLFAFTRQMAPDHLAGALGTVSVDPDHPEQPSSPEPSDRRIQ